LRYCFWLGTAPERMLSNLESVMSGYTRRAGGVSPVPREQAYDDCADIPELICVPALRWMLD